MRPQYTCAICGAKFNSYNPNPTYCSFACRVESQKAAVDVGRLRELYENGHTQSECAAMLGVSQKAIHGAMRRHGIPTRVAAKRDQWGERNHMWKGEGAGYSAKHYRVVARFGSDRECEVCGVVSAEVWYDWANLSGNYGDPKDYKRMCRSCHRQYDKRRREVMPNDAA